MQASHQRSFPLGLDYADSQRSKRLYVRALIECTVETKWGDTVVVCGSTQQLGSWQPERGRAWQQRR